MSAHDLPCELQIRRSGQQISVGRKVSVEVQVCVVQNATFRVVLKIAAQKLEAHINKHDIRNSDDDLTSFANKLGQACHDIRRIPDMLKNVRENKAIESLVSQIIRNIAFNVVDPTFGHRCSRAFGFRIRSGNPKHFAMRQSGFQQVSVVSGATADIEDSSTGRIDLIDDERVSDILIHSCGER